MKNERIVQMFRETLKNINKEQSWSEQNNFEAAFDKSHMT